MRMETELKIKDMKTINKELEYYLRKKTQIEEQIIQLEDLKKIHHLYKRWCE